MLPARLRPGPTVVGLVERSETHHRHAWAQTGRWVSLRSTHPTEKKLRKVPRPCRFHWPCFVVQHEGQAGRWRRRRPMRVMVFVKATEDSERGLPPAAEMTAMFERSEEHTSELQSLMRISYAVFCLKKKKK